MQANPNDLPHSHLHQIYTKYLQVPHSQWIPQNRNEIQHRR